MEEVKEGGVVRRAWPSRGLSGIWKEWGSSARDAMGEWGVGEEAAARRGGRDMGRMPGEKALVAGLSVL